MLLRNLLFVSLLSLLGRCLSEPSNALSASIDLSVYLLYLPYLMNTVGLKNLREATSVFLESGFELFDIPIESVTVSVASQSLDGRQALGTNSTYFAVQTTLEVLVKYPIYFDDQDTSRIAIEEKIRNHMNDDWTDLSEMLKQLDPHFFENLRYIELQSKENTNFFGPSHSLRGSENSGGVPENVLIIYLALAVGIVLTALTLLVPCCLAKIRSKRYVSNQPEKFPPSCLSHEYVDAESPYEEQ